MLPAGFNTRFGADFDVSQNPVVYGPQFDTNGDLNTMTMIPFRNKPLNQPNSRRV
jgi:hypothetical protein